MTLESTICVNKYIGNGITTDFPFTFKVWNKDQVRVLVGDGETETDESSACTIEISDTGGTVAFPVAPASGQRITIRRGMPFTQEDDYRNGTRFDAEEVEDRFDQDCAERQEILYNLDRAVLVPETSEKSGTDVLHDMIDAKHEALDAAGQARGAESWLHDFVADVPEGDVSLNNVTSWNTSQSRSLAERCADVINVKDYGAKGDGVTDDTTAFTAAFNAAKLRPRATVVAYGSFVVSSQISFAGCYSISVYIEEIHVKNWQMTASDPLFLVPTNEHKIYVGRLDCEFNCAGILLTGSDNRLLDGCFIIHYKTYGVSWSGESSGNNYIGAISVFHCVHDDSQFTDFTTPRGPCLLVDGIDSRVCGASFGWGEPTVKFTANASLNTLQNCHIWHGATEQHKAVDAVIVENLSPFFNTLKDCYLDNGAINLYNPSLRIIGGLYYVLESVATVTPPQLRYYAPSDSAQGDWAVFDGVSALKPGFLSYDGNDWDGDFSAIASYIGSSDDLGVTTKIQRIENHIVPPTVACFKTTLAASDVLFERHVFPQHSPVVTARNYNSIRFGVEKDVNTNKEFMLLLGFDGINGVRHTQTGDLDFYGNNTLRFVMQAYSFYPYTSNNFSLGTASNLFTQLYASSSTINTSDQRDKQDIKTFPPEILNAWDNVSWCQFRFKDAVAEKGETARTHAGAIAQQIKEVLENAGIDPFVYGLLCYDEWDSEKEERATFDIPHPEKLDDNGNVVEKAWIEHKTEILKPAKKAGNKYSLRYIECLSVEAAYQRYRFEKLEKRLSNLEDMVRQIVESIKKQ